VNAQVYESGGTAHDATLDDPLAREKSHWEYPSQLRFPRKQSSGAIFYVATRATFQLRP